MSRRRDALIGTVVANRYKVERMIGKGGMGAIYEVSHTRFNKRFALKTLSPDLLEDAEALARFQREAHIVAAM